MRRTRDEWQKLIRKQERSGLEVDEFAAKQGVKAGTLRWWRSRLRREAGEAPALLPVRVIASTALAARRVEQSSATIEAELIDGIRLRFVDAPSELVVAVIAGLRRC